MTPRAKILMLVVILCGCLSAVEGMHAIGFDSAFDDPMESQRCYCDSCSSIFNDKCDDCQVILYAL